MHVSQGIGAREQKKKQKKKKLVWKGIITFTHPIDSICFVAGQI
jgi:hypothetical protein